MRKVPLHLPGDPTQDGGPIALKWHRLKLASQDAPFRRDRLNDGLRHGAVLEVDVQALGDGTLVCLHDDHLDRETTGHGLVAETRVEALSSVTVRGDGGQRPLLLTELADALAAHPHAGVHLQLDVKLTGPQVTDAVLWALSQHMAAHAARLVLSGYDWGLVGQLASALPGAGRGYDPLHTPQAATAMASPGDPARWTALLVAILGTAPSADWVYLHHPFVWHARAVGIDLVGPLQAAGAKIDAWTVDVDDRHDWRSVVDALRAAKVDQITTNTAHAMAEMYRA